MYPNLYKFHTQLTYRLELIALLHSAVFHYMYACLQTCTNQTPHRLVPEFGLLESHCFWLQIQCVNQSLLCLIFCECADMQLFDDTKQSAAMLSVQLVIQLDVTTMQYGNEFSELMWPRKRKACNRYVCTRTLIVCHVYIYIYNFIC